MGSDILAPLTLSSDLNKNKGVDAFAENQEGLIQEEDDLDLKTPDEDILKLCKNWEDEWKLYRSNNLLKKWENNTKYWKADLDSNSIKKMWRGIKTNNIIFIAQETYLNMVTRQDPEPNVMCNNTEEGTKLSHGITGMIQHLQRRELKLKSKIKQIERFRDMYYMGVAKMVWDPIKQEMGMEVKRPHKLILDPDATVTDCEYDGEYIGEYREETVSTLKDWFPKKKAFLDKESKDKEGSKLGFIEYWTRDMHFYKMGDEILGKFKNPMWNWDKTDIETQMNDNGDEIDVKTVTPGKNYFKQRKMPYIFLVVYNLGLHPHDETSTMEQSITLQNMANERLEQIDKNINKINGGWIVNGTFFTHEQAKMLADAVQNGGVVRSNAGADNMAQLVMQITGQNLPGDVFNNMLYLENAIRNLYGVGGSTSEGLANEKTVRGKIMAGNVDQQRNSGPSEFIEQFVNMIYEWMVQMMFVFYDEKHYATILGQEKSVENIELMNTDLFDQSISVTVKSGSLLPKDPVSERNEAIDLFTGGVMDPISLFEKLDFPNPKQAAERLTVFKMDPIAYAKGMTLDQVLQQQQQSAMAAQGGMPAEQPAPQGGGAIGSEEQPVTQENPNLLSEVPVV